MEDMLRAGLAGMEGSAERRRELGKILGIGYGNVRGFLQKLNKFEVKREAFERAVKEI